MRERELHGTDELRRDLIEATVEEHEERGLLFAVLFIRCLEEESAESRREGESIEA